MLRRVSFVANSQFKLYEMPKSKLVQLNGDRVVANTILSVTERSIVSDFSVFYDEFDKGEGINYLDSLEQVNLEFDYGSLSFINSKVVKRFSTKKDFHCIRYVGGDKIRSMTSPSTADTSPDNFGVSLLEYSSALSANSWIRLKVLYNNIVGFEAISVNTSKRELNIDFSKNTEWNESALELMYIILSESFVSAHRGMRVVLLSEMTCFKDGIQFGKFLKALSSISNLEAILFTNDVSFEGDMDYCDYVKLSV